MKVYIVCLYCKYEGLEAIKKCFLNRENAKKYMKEEQDKTREEFKAFMKKVGRENEIPYYENEENEYEFHGILEMEVIE